MEEFLEFVQEFFGNRFTFNHISLTVLGVFAGAMILALLSRLFFGRHSTIGISVASSVTVLCVYLLTVIFSITNTPFSIFVTDLPFVQITSDRLAFFNFYTADFGSICTEALVLLVLAFAVNLLQRCLPKSKHLFSWLIFRIVSIALAFFLSYGLGLLIPLLPINIAEISSTVVIIVIIAALLLGALKVVVGGALAFINPLLALLYAFFFSNFVGKVLTRAILTTLILTAVVFALNYFGIYSVCIAPAVLISHIPLLVLILILWFILGRFL